MIPATARPIRVLWLIKGLGPGGAERLLVSHARCSPDDRFTYSVRFVNPAKRQLVPELNDAGVDAELLGGRSIPGWVASLRRELNREPYDVVHTHSPVLAAVARVAIQTIRPQKRPVVVATEHNNWRSYHPLTRWANGLTFATNDASIAVSGSVQVSMWPRHRDRTEVLVHGLVPEDLKPREDARSRIRSELGLGDDDVLLLTVANFKTEKAYPNLLAAAGRVLDACPQVTVAAVGQGPLVDEIRRRRDEMGLAQRFHLLGHRTDVFDLLAAADVFVLASHWEGFPIAVMEALASGLPVVATRVGGVPDAVRDGVEGLLVAPRNVEQLAHAMTVLATDSALRSRMATAARERGQDFDMRRTVARVEQIYLEALRKRGRL